MLRSILISLTLAFSAFSAHQPIIQFPSGLYLGEGVLTSTLNTTTNFSSLANISDDSLKLTIVRAGDLFGYDLDFDFTSNGFFTVSATEANSDGTVHTGQGHCQEVQCHFDVDTGTRKIEETITFATWENKIYTLGSMRYLDEDGHEQAISWQERYLLISDPSDDDDDDDDDNMRN